MNGVFESNISIKNINLDSTSKLRQIDFNKCVICQSTKQKVNSKIEEVPMKPTLKGYASLCRDLASFIDCKRDSVPRYIQSLFESLSQFEQILTENSAVYHKPCRDEYNTQKLNRLKMRCEKLLAEGISSDRQVSSVVKPTVMSSQIVDESLDVHISKSASYEETYDQIFQQIVELIEDDRQSSEQKLYKLSQLAKTMSERLNNLGFDNITIHTTRLKDQLLLAIPGFRADKIGREILLSFDENVKHLVSSAIKNDHKSNDEFLAKAAEILRETFIGANGPVFSGSFNQNFCPEQTTSKTLVKFLSTLMGGDTESSNIAENIAQIIQFNSVKHRNPQASYVRHNMQREQPLPIHIGLLIHSLSGKRSLVDELFEMGLCVSYSRVLDIERALASKVCEIYMNDNCVCPPHLTSGVFTTAAVDNIDHNPRSTTANYSFHGTGISIIQHHTEPKNDNYQQVIHLNKSDFFNKSKPSLPRNYYEIPSLPTVTGEIPLSSVNWDPTLSSTKPLQYVKDWFESNNGESISWSAYNSRSCADISSFKSTSAMLPLIKDNVNSPSVVRHTMDIVISTTQKINPGQTPVWTGDQPVYAIAKELQWLYPEKYGEDKLVVMLGKSVYINS